MPRAVGRSVETVAREFVTAVCLLLGLGLALLVVLAPIELADVLIHALYTTDWERLTVTRMPVVVVGELARAGVGVWFCMSALLWYGDARRRGRAER